MIHEPDPADVYTYRVTLHENGATFDISKETLADHEEHLFAVRKTPNGGFYVGVVDGVCDDTFEAYRNKILGDL